MPISLPITIDIWERAEYLLSSLYSIEFMAVFLAHLKD